ncbi:histidine kinase [Xaviernesmea oryzae]|uniref:Histidine kinase n=1 Tax=Xaviernesmea oryzae TaxID=464029 RepID=A0A1Q9B357_9HYPH|nr:EAL domain-containing protein [Xaviernesmea oryzae]OLP62442.1 histidine kinase [Xaviernesmea oryzae]SEM16525.1 diguanylate cyclase/phosphodiesterase [Xaviernesmea oryzae]
MAVIAAIRQLFTVSSDNPDLLKAQHRAFTRQMPMMYLILLSSTWALAATHMSSTPGWLTIGIPMVLTIGCVTRIFFWWRTRHAEPTPERAYLVLRRTNALSVGIAVAFTAWSFLLVPYGDAYAQSHVAFYMAITVISCIFCLTHVRSAALIVTLIVNGAFIVFFLSLGQATFAAITINVALVCFGMMSIVFTNYRHFEQMVVSQQQTQALSNENLRLANVDRLTDLPNRRAFFSHLESMLQDAEHGGKRLALGIIDLDGFKPINDLYGHSVGDRLLIEIGRRLAQQPPNVLAFRLGGDEFAVVVTEASSDQQLIDGGNVLTERLHLPIQMPEATVRVSASIGIAVYPDLAGTAEQLFDRADYALYHAKKARRGGAVLFTSDHERRINIETRIEQALKQCDPAQELSIVFQPIIDLRDGAIMGFESLARWESPTLGRVPPSRFFPIAERAGIVGMLTRPLLQKALAIARGWEGGMRLSFNLSAQDLTSAESVLALVSIVNASGFDPHRLDFEITETAFTHDFDQVERSVDMLRALGCGISLDDFGIGYSSLTRLHALPLTKIKIDRSFVSALHQRPASFKIVKSVLALSRDMELECVVEGVETGEELAVLQRLGAVFVQGYLFSPPLAEAEVSSFLVHYPERRIA